MEAAEKHSLALSELAEPHERLRRSLVASMEVKGIGIAGLQRRLGKKGVNTLKAIKRDDLMLFLAGRKSPNAELVRVCESFVGTAGETDPVAGFGDAVAAFGQAVNDRGRAAALAGSYEITAFVEPVAGSEFMEGVRPELEYGQIGFEVMDDRPFLRATLKEPDEDAAGQPHWFEGVALIQAHGLSVILREVLTRRSKVLMLNIEPEGKDARLTGAVMAPGFDGRSGAGASVMDISLTPVKPGQG